MSRKRNFGMTGDAAMQALRDEQEKDAIRREQAQNKGPMRFWVAKKGKTGYEEHELVILDEDATEAFHVYEHSTPGPNNNFAQTTHDTCIDDWDDCPLCRAAEKDNGDRNARFKASRFNMYLTVLDLTPYKIQNGARAGTIVNSTRKLYVVPAGAMEGLKKMLTLCKKNNGTTRGMVMVVTKKQQMDARCGEPQMLDNGMLFDFMTDEELEEYADEAVVREGKTILAEGENIEPFDYEKILEPKDASDISRAYGFDASVGSNADEERTTGSARRRRRKVNSADAETGSAGEDNRTRRRTRTASEDAEEEAPPTRTRRTRAAAPEEDAADAPGAEPEPRKPRGRTRRQAAQGTDGEPDIPFDDA